jgi:hypothetical protein
MGGMTEARKCEPDCTCAKHTNSGGKGGIRAKCAPDCTCARHNRKAAIDWNDPEARKAYNRQKANEKYAADPEKIKERQRKYYEKKRAENPDYWKNWRKDEGAWLKYAHGITMEQRLEMLESQGGNCYLCEEPLDVEAPRGVHVDHDHQCCRGNRSCGKCIRGLACHSCNTGIGLFGDDPDRIERAAANLEAANERVRNDRT